MLKKLVLLAGLVLFESSGGMITEQQLESGIEVENNTVSIADLVEKAVEGNDKPKVLELLRSGLAKAINGERQIDVPDLLNAIKPFAEKDITNVLRDMFDDAAELRQFDIAKLILQASPDEICVGYAFDQGLSAKSAEGTKFALWLLKHPSARMQYTPRHEEDVYTVSYFLTPAVVAGNAEIIRLVIDGTLGELALYEHSKNLNKFLRDELDPLYSSENTIVDLLPSKYDIREMFYFYINKKDRNLIYLPDFVDINKIEEMKNQISDWTLGK